MVKSMRESHKRAHRHPKYKTAYRVNNWREYDQSLRDRGDVTLWISQDVIAAWRAPMTGKRGAQPVYSDIAIETTLALRLLFHPPLRQTEGFLHAVLTLMGLTLPCPDHTTLSRRHATVEVRRQVEHAPQGPLSLIVDSSGLKVCGQGEWQSQKYGEKKHKRWKKLHIGVDAQGQIIASTVTESHEQDPSQVPELLSQVDYVIERFIGDGIYDQAPVYAAVTRHSPGARVVVPPREDAVLSSQVATSPTQRDGHILAIASAGRFPWKRTSGYYAQSHAENAFSRYKRMFGSQLRAKNAEAQEREAAIACGVLKWMREWGRPQSYRVG
jgi:Transposase DDE domain